MAGSAAISAADFFSAHAGALRDYVRVYAARAVGAGETYLSDMQGFIIETRATAPGYEVTAYHDRNESNKTFMTQAEFAAKTAPADQLAPSMPRDTLAAEDLKRLTPVARGARIIIDAGLPVQTTATYDGFTVDIGGDLPIYMSNYELTTMFNYAGAKKQTHEDRVVTLQAEAPMTGIIVTEETTFAFKAGDYTAPAGSFIYINPYDVDGYTAVKPGFAQFGLRPLPVAQSVVLGSALDVRKKPVSFKK